MRSGALLPANVRTSLMRLDRADRQAKIGQMLNPTAARASAKPLGASAAGGDFFDRMGPEMMRAVKTLIGQPAVQPSQLGQIPRSPYAPPAGIPERMDFSSSIGDRKPWESIADGAQKTFDEAHDLLQSMEDGTATSQAELLAIQQKFVKAQQMFQMASTVMKSVHDTRKAMIQNLRP